MTSDKSILIKNIYYMLSYAFRVLQQSNYEEIAAEDFENVQDLLAAILSKGIAQQLKQGLFREYSLKADDLPLMRGKISVTGTIRHRLRRQPLLACEYDELSENNTFNQILKTTFHILLRQPTVRPEHKTALKKARPFFDGVDLIDPTAIPWSTLRYRRNNQSYKMLINLCYFVLDGLLLTTEKGDYKLASFLKDDHMSTLYEKFVLEYYRYHHPELRPCAAQITWILGEKKGAHAGGEEEYACDDLAISFLPKMQTDITLRHNDKTLIIDTKYYTHTMQTHTQYDSRTLHSHNLYQIFTYVKNYDVTNTGNVSGMLLYAKTDEAVTPDFDYLMSGNRISVKTLDLNTSFEDIQVKLDKVVEEWGG